VIVPPSSSPTRARISPLAWVFAGVAVAAGGTGAYFGVRSISDQHRLKTSCAGRCNQDEVDAVARREDVATVTIGAAVVSGGIAAYLFLNPSKAPATTLPAREVLVTPLLGGGGVASWLQRF
jgi:hypothetical protein